MTQDCCLCFPLHVRSDMVALKVPPGSLTGWRIKIFLNNVGGILLFACLHRSLTVKSEQGQYWRNEPRNLAGSWRCGFLVTVEVFGYDGFVAHFPSCVFSGLLLDVAAGRLLWDILFGWLLSEHVLSCARPRRFLTFSSGFLGPLAKMEIFFGTVSSFFFCLQRTLAFCHIHLLTFEGTLACLVCFYTYIYLFLSMEF